MFIVTMVFLAGVIFTVQQLLFQYSAIDLSQALQKTDYYVLLNAKNVIQKSIVASDCDEAYRNLREVRDFLLERPLKGFGFSFLFNGEPYPNLNCTNWDTSRPVLRLWANIIGSGTDTTAEYDMYNYEKELFIYIPWWQSFLEPWVDILREGNVTPFNETLFLEAVVYVMNRTAEDVNCTDNQSVIETAGELEDIDEYLSEDLGNYTLEITYFNETTPALEPVICAVENCTLDVALNLSIEQRVITETRCLP